MVAEERFKVLAKIVDADGCAVANCKCESEWSVVITETKESVSLLRAVAKATFYASGGFVGCAWKVALGTWPRPGEGGKLAERKCPGAG